MCKQKKKKKNLAKISVVVQVDEKKRHLGVDEAYVHVHMGISLSLGAPIFGSISPSSFLNPHFGEKKI